MDAHFKFLSMSAVFSHSLLPIRNLQGLKPRHCDLEEHYDGNLSPID